MEAESTLVPSARLAPVSGARAADRVTDAFFVVLFALPFALPFLVVDAPAVPEAAVVTRAQSPAAGQQPQAPAAGARQQPAARGAPGAATLRRDGPGSREQQRVHAANLRASAAGR